MFSCEIKNAQIEEQIRKIGSIPSLERSPLCLPNIHYKKGLESPPQFVAITSGTIVPTLSAPSMNCGMSIIRTSLSKEDFSEEFLNKFALNLRKHVEMRLSKLQTFLLWVGLKKRKKMKYDLSINELEDIFKRGAISATEKYELSSEVTNNIEYNGSLFNAYEQENLNLNEIVPRSSYTNALHEMGYNFGGNHFLEIHFVEKIEDKNVARQMGIEENQVILFYHGGGGHATYHLGRYFGNRKKNSVIDKIFLFFLKIIFHFGSFSALKNVMRRWKYYFTPSEFQEIPLSSHEGKRLMNSIKASLNYGYAFRVALLKRIKDSLNETINNKKIDVSFIWDASHNSIVDEMRRDKKVIVHRQDAMRVFKDKPVMVSGKNNTLSYIGVGGENAHKSEYSLSPSAAKTIEKTRLEDIQEKYEYTTLISKRKNSELKKVSHISSEGLFKVVDIFEKKDIIRPVAYIRPLAVIKGH